jgi:DNA-binding NtrC family response regulator
MHADLTEAGDTGEPRQTLKTMVEDYERALIEAALASAGGHQRRAAALLQILPSTLCEKMKRLGMRRRRPDAP